MITIFVDNIVRSRHAAKAHSQYIRQHSKSNNVYCQNAKCKLYGNNNKDNNNTPIPSMIIDRWNNSNCWKCDICETRLYVGNVRDGNNIYIKECYEKRCKFGVLNEHIYYGNKYENYCKENEKK